MRTNPQTPKFKKSALALGIASCLYATGPVHAQENTGKAKDATKDKIEVVQIKGILSGF
ncbi:MAG: hypothetical protein MJK04_13380 [Psychrosphaera sp.]|nr:hypothetical protein [Psychrosphaera sp.]